MHNGYTAVSYTHLKFLYMTFSVNIYIYIIIFNTYVILVIVYKRLEWNLEHLECRRLETKAVSLPPRQIVLDSIILYIQSNIF